MQKNIFKLFLLIVVLTLSNSSLLAQYEWQKYLANPLNIHGSPGSWDQSVGVPCVIFNSDLNRYEMWYTSGGNNGIGFAWSTDGIIWTNHPTAVLTPSPSSWDYPFVGVACVLKEGGTYKMWYTGGQTGNLTSSHIGYATSTNCTTWTKHDDPVLSPGTGWESGAVGYPSVIKISDTYYMFYSGAVTVGIARTGRAISSDGITWQKDTVHNPVLPAGGTGQWDRNNYLGKVIDLNNTLYIYYTGETNPGVSGTAIGFATSTDLGITWTKFENNPILPQGTSGQWDYGWIEGGCPVFANSELRLYYDGGGAATGWLGRIGLAISDPLPAETYTIGTGGNFSTIQDAFDKLETDGVAGNVTLELIDNLYTAPTDSFGFHLDGPIPGAGTNSRVTIKPTENKNVVIEGNGMEVMSYTNTSFVTMNGNELTGNSTLTFHAIYNTQYSWNSCLDFWNNSDHNIVQNITFISDDYYRYGGGPAFYTRIGSTSTADSNLIQNNFIKKAGIGFYVSSYNSTARATGNIIRENIIGSETDTLISWGIDVVKDQNSIIEDNVVQGIRGGSSALDIAPGISCYACLESTIRNNIVHNVNTSYTGGSMGIALLGDGSNGGNGNLVYNNMVYDINSSSTTSYSNIGGIHLEYQNNTKVYYNSVYLSGTGSNHQGSGAFYIFGPGSSNTELKNNIFVNTRDESPYCASAIYLQTASTLTSDYNDLYYDDTNNNNCLVRIYNTDYHSLSDWQTTGKDVHSYVEMPPFISSTDLHIDETIPTYLESRGIPIAGINTDFDGDQRNADSTDIGADEFDGIYKVTGVENELGIPTEYALEQNYPNPFNPSTAFRYSIPTQSKVVIKVFDILGNEVSTLMDEEKSVGTYELTWNAVNLSSGIYFYQLKAGEFVNTKKMILLK